MYCFITELPLNFTMCWSMLYWLSFDSTFENFENDLIFKALFVLLPFLLSAKCRFCRISRKQFRIIVFWIPSLPIILSTLQYSAIVDNLLIVITKFILRIAFSCSLVTVKFLPFHSVLIVQLFETGHKSNFFYWRNCFV